MLSPRANRIGTACLALLLIFSGWSTWRHWSLQTDILDLLPSGERDPAMQTLRNLVSGRLGRISLFMLSGQDPDSTAHATRKFGQALKQSDLFEWVEYDYGNRGKAFYELYFPLRYQILSPQRAAQLETPDAVQTLLQNTQRQLYQPSAAMVTRFIQQDPLLFFPSLLEYWSRKSDTFGLYKGLPHQRDKEGQHHFFITAQLKLNPYDKAEQEQFHDTLAAIWAQIQTPQLDLKSSSAARFARASRIAIEADITRIGLGSLLGILLLLLLTFRGLKSLFVAQVPLILGIAAAFGVTLAAFGSLHVLTLAFGCSLIGICIDYSFHFLAHHRLAHPWNPNATARHLARPLILGAITTLMSYAALAFTPLPGLAQIALFSSTGILVALSTVLIFFPRWYPAAHPRANQKPRLLLLTRKIAHLKTSSAIRTGTWIALATVAALGISRLTLDDSPQALNQLPPHLVAEDRAIRSQLGATDSTRFVVVAGRSPQKALQNMEQWQQNIQTQHPQLATRFGPWLTDFVPSIARQTSDWQRASHLAQSQQLATQLDQIGFEPETSQNLITQLQQPMPQPLTPEKWLGDPASAGLRNLWLGTQEEDHAILIHLRGQPPTDAQQKWLATQPGVRYFDQVQDFTRVLKRYRERAVLMAGLAYVAVFLLLAWHYRRHALQLMLPPLMAALCALGALGWLDLALNFIHCLALLLILGMGVDYSLFMRESRSHADHNATLLALTLSALTTILSFGLLAFSDQALLKALGTTTFVGIAAAWLAAITTLKKPN